MGPSRDSMAFTSTKGLLNGPGQNNCFLNSAVQVRIFFKFYFNFITNTTFWFNSEIIFSFENITVWIYTLKIFNNSFVLITLISGKIIEMIILK